MNGPPVSLRKEWVLCVFLFLATTLNYLDRQTMSILAPRIQKEMGFDNEALGWLFSAFYYSYTFSQFGVGLLLDRHNLRWMYGFAVLAWSATASLTALAPGFTGLLVFRLLLGVAESANWPAAMRIVARALPPRDRALGNGIFTSGTSVGALIAPPVLLGIAAWAGWRWAFVVVGSLGVIWFGAWAVFTRHPGFGHVWKDQGGMGAGEQAPVGRVYGRILRNPQFWRVFAVTILVNPCLYFNLNWLPTYLVQERGLQAGHQMGLILTAVYLGLDLGYLACGAAVMYLARRGCSLRTARRAVFLGASVLLGLCGAVPLVGDLTAAAAVLVAVNFGAGVWIAMYLTLAQEVTADDVSTAAGLLGGSGALAGAVAMWAVGPVTRRTSSFAAPMAGVTVAALVAALAGVAANRGITRQERTPQFADRPQR